MPTVGSTSHRKSASSLLILTQALLHNQPNFLFLTTTLTFLLKSSRPKGGGSKLFHNLKCWKISSMWPTYLPDQTISIEFHPFCNERWYPFLFTGCVLYLSEHHIRQTNSPRTCKPTSFCCDHRRRFTCHFLNNVEHYFVFFPAWLISTMVPIFNYHLCKKASHDMTCSKIATFTVCDFVEWRELSFIANYPKKNYQISMLQKPEVSLKQFIVQLVHILKVVLLKKQNWATQ